MKSDTATTKKKLQDNIAVELDVKILNRILANQIQSTLKGSYTMNKWDLSLHCQNGSTYKNQF